MFKNIFKLFVLLIPVFSFGQTTDQASAQYRPEFHFSPAAGWMSDPNGLVYLDGEYHLFYQHRFKGAAPGMYWGHSVSKNLINWTTLPVALAPDSLGYIYSGSCVVDLKNTSKLGSTANPPLLAFFTYHNLKLAYKESQAMAYSLDKGRTWKKYSQNPVIKNPGLKDFRDPKVFWNASTKDWRMVVSMGDHVAFYGSKNAVNWDLLGEFGKGIGDHIGPWECPDLFPVQVQGSSEIKWVLLISVVNLGSDADRLATATQYFIGDFDGNTFTTSQKDVRWIDFGKDNYAGVTYSNVPGGRKIFQAWMQSHQYGGLVEQKITKEWAGAATFPREVKILKMDREYRLAFEPVKELLTIYGPLKSLKNLSIKDSLNLTEKLNIKPFPIELKLRLENRNLPEKFGILLRNKYKEEVRITYDRTIGQLSVDRTKSTAIKFHDRFSAEQKAKYHPNGKNIEWTLLLDKASLELFAADGTLVFTETFYPTRAYDQLAIFSEGGILDIQQINIRPLEVKSLMK